MKGKIIFTYGIVLTIIASGMLYPQKVSAKAEIVEKFSEEYFQRANKATEIYPSIIRQFKTETTTTLSNLTSRTSSLSVEYEYSNDYAGTFLDDQGILNVMITKNNQINTRTLSVIDSNENVQVLNVPFSYNYLNEIQNSLTDVMSPYKINCVGISQKNNRVDIFMDTLEYRQPVIDYLIENSLYQENAVNFILQTSKLTKGEYDNYAMAGTQIWYNHGVLWLQKTWGTIGANVIDNDTGKKGVLTNAHVAASGKTMKHDNGTIGARTKGWYGGTIDAAFVPFSKSHWELTDLSTYGDQSTKYAAVVLGQERLIVEGYPTVKFGYTTGKTQGTITHTNTSTNIKYSGDSTSTIITNVIRYSNQSLGGDSGGPVYYNGGTKGSYHLIALNYAGPADPNTYTYGVGCRITNVLSELNLTLITCQNIYDYT